MAYAPINKESIGVRIVYSDGKVVEYRFLGEQMAKAVFSKNISYNEVKHLSYIFE